MSPNDISGAVDALQTPQTVVLFAHRSAALEAGISVQKYLNLVADCILFGFFYAAEALLMVWEVSKGPAVFGWQHKMSFYTL